MAALELPVLIQDFHFTDAGDLENLVVQVAVGGLVTDKLDLLLVLDSL